MTPQCKIRTANVLMFIGIAPLTLGLSWIAVTLSSVPQYRGEMGGSDAFLMLALGIVTYLFAVIVAAPSAIWSALILRRNPDLRSKSASVFSKLICVALAVPLLWYISIQLGI